MGNFLFTPSESDDTSSSTAAVSPAMSPSNSVNPHELESTQSPDSVSSIHDPPTNTKTAKNEESAAENEKDLEKSMNDGEEEEGECGFCLFMKGGGCKETFVGWEKCVEAAEKREEDVVEKCFQATEALKKCMEAHSDYYGPILQAEKSMEEEAVKQLEEEKEKEEEMLNGEGGGSQDSEKIEKEEALGGK